ncbi:MAG: transposase [Deltaproteobacteria bacterium]|nr:transposase [Deltaproteobacteria bacterium]MBW2118499.1 transposase [Deltaproteobacteria bacterium]MBW2345777.1 transposase [Deltaproteobacteria bacterium]
MASNIKQRKQIHLRNFNYKGSSFVYYITICTSKKQPYFQNEKITKVIADEMEFRRANKEVRLFCYCIMPDHLHMLLSFTEDYHKTLQNWVSAFKRYTTRVVNELYGIKPLWQKNFYDHIVRKEESLLKIAEYILNNPVRKGMVPNWENYPYSKIADPLPL